MIWFTPCGSHWKERKKFAFLSRKKLTKGSCTLGKTPRCPNVRPCHFWYCTPGCETGMQDTVLTARSSAELYMKPAGTDCTSPRHHATWAQTPERIQGIGSGIQIKESQEQKSTFKNIKSRLEPLWTEYRNRNLWRLPKVHLMCFDLFHDWEALRIPIVDANTLFASFWVKNCLVVREKTCIYFWRPVCAIVCCTDVLWCWFFSQKQQEKAPLQTPIFRTCSRYSKLQYDTRCEQITVPRNSRNLLEDPGVPLGVACFLHFSAENRCVALPAEKWTFLKDAHVPLCCPKGIVLLQDMCGRQFCILPISFMWWVILQLLSIQLWLKAGHQMLMVLGIFQRKDKTYLGEICIFWTNLQTTVCSYSFLWETTLRVDSYSFCFLPFLTGTLQRE